VAIGSVVPVGPREGSCRSRRDFTTESTEDTEKNRKEVQNPKNDS